jgi:Cysteine-rich CPCC
MMTNVCCPICGYLTIENRCDWDICPVCFWEDDVLVVGDKDASSSANGGMFISTAQANYMLYGYSDPKHQAHVRPPNSQEAKDPQWTPLTLAIESVANRQKA